MRFFEFASAVKKPLTPDQLRIKSLQDKAKRARQAVRAERAQQKINAGLRDLNKIPA